MKIDIDDREAMSRYDSKNMIGLIEGLPEQCREAWKIGLGGTPLRDADGLDNVVVLGLGGSAIGGDLLAALLSDELDVPVLVNRGYGVPNFVGKSTLVIACSYSGNTEETLTAYGESKRRGAKIVAITSGGKLREMAIADGVELLGIPGGLAPRAALGYVFLPAVAFLAKCGLIKDKAEDVEEAYSVLSSLRDELGPNIPKASNFAKSLAEKLVGKLPVIYGTTGISGPCAYRWKCQINENSKTHAYSNVLPEMNHNETVGWDAPDEIARMLYVILLRDSGDSERIATRMNVTKELMKNSGGIEEITSRGKSRLARMLSLIYIGDFVSLYLAFLYGQDPGPVKAIDYLKAELAKLG